MGQLLRVIAAVRFMQEREDAQTEIDLDGDGIPDEEQIVTND